MRTTVELPDALLIADIPELPGVRVYGTTKEEVGVKAVALALHVIAEEFEHGELKPEAANVKSLVAA